MAEGFERLEPLTAEVAGKPYSWLERRLVICSARLTQAGERRLRARLAKAQAAITALNRLSGMRGAATDPNYSYPRI